MISLKNQVASEPDSKGDDFSTLLDTIKAGDHAAVELKAKREDRWTGLEKATQRGRRRNKTVNFRATERLIEEIEELSKLWGLNKADTHERAIREALASVKRKKR
ncbi:MAG: hypothetical protein AAFV69_08700 [Pseudomonadota bacterium]